MSRNLFNYSLVILSVQVISIFFHIKNILIGIPIYTDYAFLAISVSIYLILFGVANNKHWRLGVIFVVASGLAKYSSVIISQKSLALALFLGILSLLLLVPAMMFFLKLRNIVIPVLGTAQKETGLEDLREGRAIYSWFQRYGSIQVIALCAPVVVGTAVIIITKMFRPGNVMPLKTEADRFFVNLFSLGVPLGLIGLPLVLIGIVIGVRLIWREHGQTKQSFIVFLSLVIGIAASIYMIAGTVAVSFFKK